MFENAYMIGFKPNELLDLEYYQYIACLNGYKRNAKNEMALAAQTGFYCAYFAMSKHAKPLKTILEEIYKEPHQQAHADTVDVEEFLRREKIFKENMSEWQKINKQK